jgi:hypothetical protein
MMALMNTIDGDMAPPPLLNPGASRPGDPARARGAPTRVRAPVHVGALRSGDVVSASEVSRVRASRLFQNANSIRLRLVLLPRVAARRATRARARTTSNGQGRGGWRWQRTSHGSSVSHTSPGARLLLDPAHQLASYPVQPCGYQKNVEKKPPERWHALLTEQSFAPNLFDAFGLKSRVFRSLLIFYLFYLVSGMKWIDPSPPHPSQADN